MLATEPVAPERDRWFAGTLLRIVADRADTGGALTVMEQQLSEGFSPPLHVHRREDTAILVLEGELTVAVDGAEQTLAPGGFVWLPRGLPHSFRVDSAEARILELATPGGIEGFHVDASDVAASATLPQPEAPDVARMIAAAAAHEVDIVGPPMS